MSTEDLLIFLKANGYENLRVMDDGAIVGTSDLLFTRALFIGLNPWSWERRYCYERRELATIAALVLDNEDAEPLPGWIARR